MRGIMIAALLAGPPGSADAFCAGLKRIVDAGPDGFVGVPLTLPNPVDPATPFTCEIEPGTLDEAVHEEHPDFVCEARKPESADSDARLERDADALDDIIQKCALPGATATGRNGIATPNAVIGVGITFLNDERVTPSVATSGLRITVHRRRSGADAA
ncbi:hypothetical protein OF829_10990 [Sphingomonas sp. LB-2]|uniref:hypothetical protein n=1 Tax=Sphingomonas caeni TaxID=2984949 RepID=UPI0022305F9F|nr:hypothetical protein [Sphingomonas caeni]MCW3847767.1 hypothetical protein [Sphingomonas caeni]